VRRFFADRILTASGLHWACFDGGRVERIFVGDDAEQRAKDYTEMTERSDVTAHAAE
jgi:hypothetical protein